jgi:lysophospholipid acyltransferase (LPLAT)-like uncharacterized protein
MVGYVRKGYRGGIVVDAPTGPPYVSKIGIIVLAKRSGLPLVPVMWSADRYWRLKSWDRSIIPKPFSNVVFVQAERFLEVPEDASREDCERIRARLDDVLRRMMYQTDHFFEHPEIEDPREIPVPDPMPSAEELFAAEP